jgi:hypothetical protein
MKRVLIIFFLIIFAVLSLSSLILSDTIVLKNGQKIHTSWIKIENGLLTYKYTYGKMTIKMDLVKEIKKDDTTDPKKETTEPEEPSDSSSTTETTATANETSKNVDPKASGSFWNGERKRLMTEKTQLEAELKDLENYRVALIRSRRSTTEINNKILEKKQRLQDINTNLSKIMEDARQFGVSQWDIDHADEQNKESSGENSGEGNS